MIWRFGIYLFFMNTLIKCQIEGSTSRGPMNAPNITDVTSSSIRVVFTPVDRARIYYVKITSRHTSAVWTVCVKSTGEQISGLDSGTIYYVSIKTTGVNGTIAPDSPHAEIHTLPGPPTIITSTPQPNSVFVFFRLKNYARVSQWAVEYVNVGSGTTVSTNTVSGEYYHVWLSGLEASTEYIIRARASEIWGTDVLNNTDFSDWHTFKTAALSVFGRVVLSNASYQPQHAVPESAEFREVQTIIRNAYARKLEFITKINVLEIEDIDGKPLVHYQLEVTEAELPSTRDFKPNGAHFSDPIINNGDESAGFPAYYKDATTLSWELSYERNTTRICTGTLEILAYVAVENGSTLEIYLMQDGVKPITSDPAYVIFPNHIRVNGVDLSPYIFFGVPLQYRVKDCISSTTVPLFNEYYSAMDVSNSFATLGQLKYTTAPVEATLQANKIEYTFSSDGKSVTLNVPALEKAISYEILDKELQSVFAKLERNDLDGSGRWKITIPCLVDSTEYTFRIRVTFRKHNGETALVSSELLSFITNSSQCEGCATNSHCFSYFSTANVTCECNFGYIGDGRSCEKIQHDRSNSSCHENTTSEENACSIGYFRNGTNCEDIDECGNSTTNDCHDNAACTNTNGSYHCTCSNGYRGDGKLCNDTDECIDSTMHSCHGDATCTNTEGSYECTCEVGFTGNGNLCVAVNATVPDAPQNVSVTTITSSSVVVTADAPSNSGDIPVTKYVITISQDATDCARYKDAVCLSNDQSNTPTAFPATISGLKPYREYILSIAAEGAAGVGESAANVTFATAFGAPNLPVITSVTLIPEGVTVIFNAGSPFTGPAEYIITVTGNDGTTNTAQVSSTAALKGITASVLNLTESTTYSVSIVAQNAQGSSASSSSESITTMPDAPQNATVLTTTADAPSNFKPSNKQLIALLCVNVLFVLELLNAVDC